MFGPVAISYNINAVDTLVLDAPTLAKIFNGTITKWNDPAITRLNQSMPPGGHHRGVPQRRVRNHADVPGLPRGRVGRRVGQGHGHGRSRAASARAARATRARRPPSKNTEGAITYNEWSFAQAQNLVHREDRDPGEPGSGAASARNRSARPSPARRSTVSGNDLALDTSSFYKPTEAGAYPIVLATYQLVCSKYPDAEVGKAVRAFLQSTIGQGQADLEDNGYMPLPTDFQVEGVERDQRHRLTASRRATVSVADTP